MCECVLLGCCGACMVGVLFYVIYFCFGIIFTTLSIQAKNAINSYETLLLDSDTQFAASNTYLNLCIAIGVLFALLTFLGYTGEKKGRKFSLIYSGAQLAIIIMGMVIYIALYPNENAVEQFLARSLNNSLHLYQAGNDTEKRNFTAAWDRVQIQYSCCGIRNYLDWEDVHMTPESCCREEHRMRGCSGPVSFGNPYESNKIIYVQGCLDDVRTATLGRINFLDYFLIPILVFTCMGFVASCCSTGVKKDDEEVEERKVGPIVLRRNTKKKSIKNGKTDVENPAEDGIPSDGTEIALTERISDDEDLKKSKVAPVAL